jgi:hypothetical protein
MPKQQIAIIGGTGDQGKGLALRWALAGYPIIIGSRAAERAATAAAEMRATLQAHAATDVLIDGAANAAAAAQAAIVVLTVPFAAQIATIKELREALAPGALVIDVTVPLEPAVGGRPSRVLGVWAGSAAEQCAELLPADVQTAAAFHNVAAAALSELTHEIACDIFVCADQKETRERVRPLVTALPGCRYVDGGALANARIVEALTALLIGVNLRYKTHAGLRITGLEGGVAEARA